MAGDADRELVVGEASSSVVDERTVFIWPEAGSRMVVVFWQMIWPSWQRSWMREVNSRVKSLPDEGVQRFRLPLVSRRRKIILV